MKYIAWEKSQYKVKAVLRNETQQILNIFRAPGLSHAWKQHLLAYFSFISKKKSPLLLLNQFHLNFFH